MISLPAFRDAAFRTLVLHPVVAEAAARIAGERLLNLAVRKVSGA